MTTYDSTANIAKASTSPTQEARGEGSKVYAGSHSVQHSARGES